MKKPLPSSELTSLSQTQASGVHFVDPKSDDDMVERIRSLMPADQHDLVQPLVLTGQPHIEGVWP